MGWIDVITASSVTTALWGVVGWLSRDLIAERLKNSVRHEFDVKLEKVRADIRAGEEHLNAVRSTALLAMSSGQQALSRRRLQAIDDLWKSKTSLGRFTLAIQMVGLMDLQKVAERATDPGIRAFVEGMLGSTGGSERFSQEIQDASSARPYLTPMAWALYSVYTAIVSLTVAQLESLKLLGTLPPKAQRRKANEPIPFIKGQPIIELVRTVFPEYAKLLDDHGAAAFGQILPKLDERLIAELRASVEGRDSDPQDVARAKRVADLVRQQEAERAAATLPLEKIEIVPEWDKGAKPPGEE